MPRCIDCKHYDVERNYCRKIDMILAFDGRFTEVKCGVYEEKQQRETEKPT